MDAAGDDLDIKLHKASGQLLDDLSQSLPAIFRPQAPAWMRLADHERLSKIINSFQEWPQLLDPRLSSYTHILISSLKTSLARRPLICGHSFNKTKISLCSATCGLLYLLCKVRGEKVIVRFFPTDAHLTQVALECLEFWQSSSKTRSAPDWEERYVTLIWLGHLLYAPFDLTTFSDEVVSERREMGSALTIQLPQGLPSIAKRLVVQAVLYLSYPSKERDSAKVLLSRLALRKDMRGFQMLDWLIEWSVKTIHAEVRASKGDQYLMIGAISLLGHLVQSDDSGDALQYYPKLARLLFTAVETTREAGDSSTALTRKAVAKALRALNVQLLKLDASGTSQPPGSDGVLEETIELLLKFLRDSDYPVRLAASKALSQIAVKLPPELVDDLVEAVLDLIEQDQSAKNSLTAGVGLDAVDPQLWHGLILTIAQFLFRRLPGSQQLMELQRILFLALQFHQRSLGGSMRGVAIRDAACFGLWSMARRYSTKELLAFPKHKQRNPIESVAINLINSACLDPSGNIRRASSAALQELVGRHPDVVTEGIPLVQAVDNQAVARRVRALEEVAPAVAQLSDIYCMQLIKELMGWRGVRSEDASSRRTAAQCIATLVRRPDAPGMVLEVLRSGMVDALNSELSEVDLLHGALLQISALLELLSESTSKDQKSHGIGQSLDAFLVDIKDRILNAFVRHALGPELMSEAGGLLVKVAAAWSKRSATALSRPSTAAMLEIVTACLQHSTPSSEVDASNAALELFGLGSSNIFLAEWLQDAQAKMRRYAPTDQSNATIKLLGKLVRVLRPGQCADRPNDQQQRIIELLFQVADNESAGAVARGAAMQALCENSLDYHDIAVRAIPVIKKCLADYSTDERGDIGSILRLAGIHAVVTILKRDRRRGLISTDCCGWRPELQVELFRLSGDRLDKVRARIAGFFELAYGTLAAYDPVTGCSYNELLRISRIDLHFQCAFFEGLLLICGAGSEKVVCSARRSLVGAMVLRSGNEGSVIYETLSRLLDSRRGADRVLTPLLQTLGFLLLTQPLPTWTSNDWLKLLSRLQKAHFQSGNVAKLLAAISCYAGLLEIPCIRVEVMRKLRSMLLFPFSSIRAAAAEVLFLDAQLRPETRKSTTDLLSITDWTDQIANLKPVVAKLKAASS